MSSYAEILLVEDNPTDAHLVEAALRERSFPHRLHFAEDGVMAMEFLKRRGKYMKAPHPDIVLLDLNLPKKDGREVLREIKGDGELCRIPVIVLTTSEYEADVNEAYRLHANCYLTKSVELEDFFGKVRQIEDFWFGTARLPRLA